jgi:hypothetical protein
MKITYFNKREREKRFRGVILGQKSTLNHPSLMEKRFRGVILGQKSTLNHPSLMDEGKETRVSMTGEKEKREGELFMKLLVSLSFFFCQVA